MLLSGTRPAAQQGDGWIAAAIGCFAFVVFLASPVHQMADSNGSMLLSQSLIRHRSFTLERHFESGPVPQQFESVRGHLYYWYPPGTSILSAPLVGGLNAFGLSATRSDGSFDAEGEERLQAVVAALLMAVLASVVFATARILLPRSWAILVAAGAAFGTQVWSTASRATWSHSWEILLLGGAVHRLLASAAGRAPLRPGWLGGLAGLMYWVRPTGVIPMAAIGLAVAAQGRRAFMVYVAVAGAGVGLFAAYSFLVFGVPLPTYYRLSSPLGAGTPLVGLAGTLLSPSRGLLVYVPVLGLIAAWLLRYRRQVPQRRLAASALLAVGVHLLLLALWPVWWGGHSYGPRLTTCLIPWFVLLGTLAVRARLDTPRRGRIEAGLGCALLLIGMALNGIGACSWNTWLWNTKLSLYGPARLWDWRRPQFLAAFRWPLPGDGPALAKGTRVAVGTIHAEPYLQSGWGPPQAGVRWTVGRRARVVFNLASPEALELRMRLQPFLVRGRLQRQRLLLFLNGKRFARLILRRPTSVLKAVPLPPELLREHNVLELRLPDATAPASLGLGPERSHLGVAVWWIELR
jgi:hypothetical protein